MHTGRHMKLFKSILLAGGALVAFAAVAQAADLPTKKAAPAAAAPNCYATFWTWLDSTAADCPLTAAGVTLYGTVDLGAGYETNGARFNNYYPNGVSEQISKQNSLGGVWQLVPGGLAQSNVGVKIKEQIAPNWFVVGDVNFGFDPYSLQFANGPGSLQAVFGQTNANLQAANGDSSRNGGLMNTRAYIGLSNPTFGTLTVGRQYAFSNDMAANYDPSGGSYGFSLIGTSGTVLSGTGDTETARENTSVKYQVQYNAFRAGALVQFGGWENGNGAQQAYQFDVGVDYAGFSGDVIYANATDAVKLGVNAGANGLTATLANVNAIALAGKYKWNALTLYSGYEYSTLSNPSDVTSLAGKTGTFNNGYTAVVAAAAYPANENLQVLWVGAKYGVLSNLDVSAAYYHEWQNNFSNGNVACTNTAIGNANNKQCAGTTDDVSFLVDWRPVKRLDVYAGVLYSVVGGGMANGFPNQNAATGATGTTSNTAFTSGVKFAF